MRLRSSGRCLPAIAEDRLSSLQDCILHCIMSFLTARQAVRTCVLSRRWSNLWRSMPCLDIDQREFDAAAPGASRYRFVEFVDRLLMLHDASSLDKFRCHVNHGCEFKVVDPWIRHGIRCSPAVMEVSKTMSINYFGPNTSFLGFEFNRKHNPSLPVSSSQPTATPNHIKGCSVSLTQPPSFTEPFPKIDLSQPPALASFHLAVTTSRSNWRDIIVNEMPSIVKASIRSESPVALCKLLCSLVHVGTLELYGSKTLGEGPDAFPTFYNLKTFLFDGCNLNDDFNVLECFLNNAPSLEKLTLHHRELPGHYRKRKRMAHEHPVQKSSACLDKLTLQCAKLNWTEIKNKLSGIWSNLQNCNITVNKV
ncbi:hypothetical protein PVAP13_7NG127917 [Panicum virgatum]|uniref:F-box domain-containing protein n=1 Tax=Panicum virgatum TaxID=38727 RepID=A0A8T0Q5T0_PANVG|nr:hypothetical protein PVAP13_7NG127917 [Panicum virgatum]